MDDARRALVEPIYESIREGVDWQLPFPSKDDEGEGNGDDNDIAEIIFYGAQSVGDGGWSNLGCVLTEKHIWFAIQMGRELERKNIPGVV